MVRGLSESVAALRLSLAEFGYIGGYTHGFYHYPARFAPSIARTAIELYSKPGDWVLDPFMGGGTSIIEGLAIGRRMIGCDVNDLAHFVAGVRTRPISPSDEVAIRAWVSDVATLLSGDYLNEVHPANIRNLPTSLSRYMSGALPLLADLGNDRQRDFVRCMLLRLGQWALDCREWRVPRRARLSERLLALCEEMTTGMGELVEACRETGVAKNKIRGRRLLFRHSAAELHEERELQKRGVRPTLVVTSPPYAGVHVLYHRWQHRGRKETPAPYWIADVQDGSPASFYTAGSRTPTGLDNYFTTITEAYSSVRQLLARRAVVVQIVGFSDAEAQVPRFMDAMEDGGFEPCRLPSGRIVRMQRRIHNRKWYHRIRSERGGGAEYLMMHRCR